MHIPYEGIFLSCNW